MNLIYDLDNKKGKRGRMYLENGRFRRVVKKKWKWEKVIKE